MMTFPHVSKIDDYSSFLFFSGDAAPITCTRCFSVASGSPVVHSGGLRIHVFYLRTPAPVDDAETLVSDPICWTCVRAGSRGSKAAHQRWRAAAGRFLDELRESDPGSYHCGLRGWA